MPELIPELDRLSSIIDRYDAIISDVWGVLHNGIVATPGAREALEAARNRGLAVTLLTNAPRPRDAVAGMLAGFGVTEAAYDALISSGAVTRTLLAKEGAVPFWHLGPERDAGLYAGFPLVKSGLEAAHFILCTGFFDDETETAEDYRAQLSAAAQRGLRLICANPDLVVERGNRLIPCAGALAELYEQIGGTVIWVGKPRRLVYEQCASEIQRKLGRAVPAERILCIGDAIRTDVAGAHTSGHDCVMTLAGIHAHQIGLDGTRYDRLALAELAERSGFRPTMAMVSLVW